MTNMHVRLDLSVQDILEAEVIRFPHSSMYGTYYREGILMRAIRSHNINASALILYFDNALNDYCLIWVKISSITLPKVKLRSVTCEVANISDKEVKEALKIGFEVLRNRRLQQNFKNPPMITGNVTKKKKVKTHTQVVIDQPRSPEHFWLE